MELVASEEETGRPAAPRSDLGNTSDVTCQPHQDVLLADQQAQQFLDSLSADAFGQKEGREVRTQQQQLRPRQRDVDQMAIQEQKPWRWERNARRRHRKAEARRQEEEASRLQEEAKVKLLHEDTPAGEAARCRKREDLFRFLAAPLGAAKMAGWKTKYMHEGDKEVHRQETDRVLWQEDQAHRRHLKAEARPRLRQAREAR